MDIRIRVAVYMIESEHLNEIVLAEYSFIENRKIRHSYHREQKNPSFLSFPAKKFVSLRLKPLGEIKNFKR